MSAPRRLHGTTLVSLQYVGLHLTLISVRRGANTKNDGFTKFPGSEI